MRSADRGSRQFAMVCADGGLCPGRQFTLDERRRVRPSVQAVVADSAPFKQRLGQVPAQQCRLGKEVVVSVSKRNAQGNAGQFDDRDGLAYVVQVAVQDRDLHTVWSDKDDLGGVNLLLQRLEQPDDHPVLVEPEFPRDVSAWNVRQPEHPRSLEGLHISIFAGSAETEGLPGELRRRQHQRTSSRGQVRRGAACCPAPDPQRRAAGARVPTARLMLSGAVHGAGRVERCFGRKLGAAVARSSAVAQRGRSGRSGHRVTVLLHVAAAMQGAVPLDAYLVPAWPQADASTSSRAVDAAVALLGRCGAPVVRTTTLHDGSPAAGLVWA